MNSKLKKSMAFLLSLALLIPGGASVYSEEAPAEEEPSVPTLFCNKKEGTLALEDKKSGKIWWSNPVDLETSNAKLSQKQELASGMTLTYGEPFPRSTTIQTSHGKGSYQVEKITDGVQ